MTAKREGARRNQELYVGLVRLHVLHHAAEEQIFGLGMMQELGRHGYRLGPGTIYPLLHGMEQRGWLRSRKCLVNGHYRKVYLATAAGRRALAHAREQVRELYEEMCGQGQGSSLTRGRQWHPNARKDGRSSRPHR